MPLRLTYEAATLDPSQARLTVRRARKPTAHRDPRDRLGITSNAREIRAAAGGHEARARGRSTNSTTRRRTRACSASGWRRARFRLVPALRSGDAKGTANPAGRASRRALAFGSSQSGRFLRDFVRDGFNQDEARAQGVRRRDGAHRGRGRRVPQRRVRAAQPHQHAARGPHVSRRPRFRSRPRA